MFNKKEPTLKIDKVEIKIDVHVTLPPENASDEPLEKQGSNDSSPYKPAHERQDRDG
jgi:hypothetical protein